jgi:plastocyanin domain-containing protein
MLGSITRDPIFCSKARILLQVKNNLFMSLMITKRLLDVVSCELKWFFLKKGDHVEALKVQ